MYIYVYVYFHLENKLIYELGLEVDDFGCVLFFIFQ